MDCPTLIVWGEQDTLVPVRDAFGWSARSRTRGSSCSRASATW